MLLPLRRSCFIIGDPESRQRVFAYQFIQRLASEKQAMEMTEYGKHGKP
jgi:hypothetical protein